MGVVLKITTKHGTTWLDKRTRRPHLSLLQKRFQKHFGRKIFDTLKFAFFKNRCSVCMVPVHIASKPHAKLRMLHSETSL